MVLEWLEKILNEVQVVTKLPCLTIDASGDLTK